VWKDDLTYRRSFIKARLKFMIDDLGVEEFRRRVEERLGKKLEDFSDTVTPEAESNHLGVNEQRQAGLYYIGFPILSGRITGEQMIHVAKLAEREGGEIRLTQQQNLILAHIPRDRVDAVLKQMEAIGIPLDGALRGPSIACTGQPFCNFAVTETKLRLVEIIHHLEQVFGPTTNQLRIFLDGCPHACGHHWIGDIGLMGTTGRTGEGEKIEAYDIILRGGRGTEAAIGKPLGRRVPAEQVKYAVERLVRTYRTEATSGGADASFQQFCLNHTDEELQAIMTGQHEERNP
jgi:ferredoxin-nitrite reductase